MTNPTDTPSDCNGNTNCTFAQFVVSLAQTAHNSLDQSGSETPNLDLASYTINVIKVLKAKTTGNLDEDERKLIEVILEDLTRRSKEIAGD